MEIIEHKLSGAAQVAAAVIREEIKPELLIVHYTANQSGAGTVSWFKSPQSGVSAHLVVDLDGKITQMVPFNRKAHHAGPSRWKDREGCNAFSIGVEIVNPGPLKRRADGQWLDGVGKLWTGGVIEARHKNGSPHHNHWAEYPQEQLDQVKAACQAIVSTYSIKAIAGHDDVAPTRKIDPGPAFPLDNLRNVLFARDQDGAETYLATTTVNVRTGPGVQNPKVDGGPLTKGQAVEVVAVNGDWWEIRTPNAKIEGWVSSRFFEVAS
jgi:N-acetylmuramoyl-L-alanine amidase